jgi:hypothetical protein
MNKPFWLDNIPAPFLGYSTTVSVDITLSRFYLESGEANANARV